MRLARCSFKRALELEPDHSEAWYGIGLTIRFSDSAQALDMFRESIRTDESHGAAHRELGHMLWRTGELMAAEQHVRRALELGPGDAWAHNYLGHLLVGREALDEATSEFRKAIALSPTPFFHTSLGDALAKQGDLVEAEQAYKDALALDTNNALSNLRYGQLLKRRQRLSRATRYLRRALHANPSDRRPQLALGEIATVQTNVPDLDSTPSSHD
jgi:Flp pilus assembly protein TadD